LKLLIIAGPYEADRIRRAAVSAGFETVAVEPGESLSGWITASRPDLIILAPKVISPDPVAALDKVQAVPRGRVPIFLVGDASEEEALQPLADGFFVRPVAPADLLERAAEALARASSYGAGVVEAEPGSDGGDRSGQSAGPPPPAARSGPLGKLPALRPLVAEHDRDAPPPVAPPARTSQATAAVDLREHLAHLSESIDADLDEEMRDVARAVGALRARPSEVAGPPSPEPAAASPSVTGEDAGGSGGDQERGDRALAASQRARVADRYALVIDGDYFQILNVPRHAGAVEVEEAYRQLAAELTPQALHPAVVSELGAELGAVHRVLDEARRFLGDDRLRQLYREHLPQPPAGDGGSRRPDGDGDGDGKGRDGAATDDAIAG
jgi:hypothetical protein